MANDSGTAWARIHFNDAEGNRQTIKAGKTVSKSDLNTTDEHWEELWEGGVIRETRWPKGLDPDNPNSLSPNEHRLRQLRRQRESVEAEIASASGANHAEEAQRQQSAPPDGQ